MKRLLDSVCCTKDARDIDVGCGARDRKFVRERRRNVRVRQPRECYTFGLRDRLGAHDFFSYFLQKTRRSSVTLLVCTGEHAWAARLSKRGYWRVREEKVLARHVR